MNLAPHRAAHESLRTNLRTVASDLDLARPRPPETVAARRRRRGLRSDREGLMQMVDRDGVIILRDGYRRRFGGLRRAAARPLPGEHVIDELPFDRLKRSGIKDALQRLDGKLTPHTGLRMLGASHVSRRVAGFREFKGVKQDGRILLFVHGTFSSNDSVLDEFRATPHGRAFLGKALHSYDQIITFDHPTLSMSPLVNARALGEAFRGTKARVDVICHSRGGLVTRWWLEGFDCAPPQNRRVVFVAAPLAGTSLASGPNLRSALSQMANVSGALGTAAAAVPFLQVATGLFQIFSSVAGAVAKTPLVDAILGLVPGLDSMARVANNQQLVVAQQFARAPAGRYSFVRSNFEPADPLWKFWKYFREGGLRDAGLSVADTLIDPIFDSHGNDLVVDTESMAYLAAGAAPIPSQRVLDFGPNGRVHHTNYFRQRETLDFIAKSFA